MWRDKYFWRPKLPSQVFHLLCQEGWRPLITQPPHIPSGITGRRLLQVLLKLYRSSDLLFHQ